jgi:hypothetical protein
VTQREGWRCAARDNQNELGKFLPCGVRPRGSSVGDGTAGASHRQVSPHKPEMMYQEW